MSKLYIWKETLIQYFGPIEGVVLPLAIIFKVFQDYSLLNRNNKGTVFLTAAWLPHGQLWATFDDVALLIQ